MGYTTIKVSVKKTRTEQRDSKHVGEKLYQPHFRQGLIPRLQKELEKLNTNKIKLPINRFTNELKGYLLKE